VGTMTPPFGWVGGKTKLAKEIIKLMPPHELYVEVFGGALAVLYAKERSKREVVNDINGDLINLHKIIKTRPETLSMYLNTMLISREIFEGIKKGEINPRNDIERAAFFYYVLLNSFNKNICSNASFAMNAKKRGANNIYKSFIKHSERLKRATIENKDFEYIIKNYDTYKTFFYLDPPYVGTEGYYKGSVETFTFEDHKRLADILKNIKGKFLLSYNDCDEVRELYKDFYITTAETNYTLRGGREGWSTAKELFITNYKPKNLFNN